MKPGFILSLQVICLTWLAAQLGKDGGSDRASTLTHHTSRPNSHTDSRSSGNATFHAKSWLASVDQRPGASPPWGLVREAACLRGLDGAQSAKLNDLSANLLPQVSAGPGLAAFLCDGCCSSVGADNVTALLSAAIFTAPRSFYSFSEICTSPLHSSCVASCSPAMALSTVNFRAY